MPALAKVRKLQARPSRSTDLCFGTSGVIEDSRLFNSRLIADLLGQSVTRLSLSSSSIGFAQDGPTKTT